MAIEAGGKGRTGVDRRAGRAPRWMAAVCVLCALALWGTAGAGWRQWRFERRGIEPRRSQDQERRAGINVELDQYEGTKVYAAIADLNALNVYWLRQRFPWAEIEPEPGVYDWARWDLIVDAAHRLGFGLIAVLDTPPEWALPGERLPLPCDTVCDADAYARFVSVFAARYGSTIDVYQVWDEPNLSRSWGGGHAQPCGYAALLEAAYPAIHGADATATVLGGGLAPTQAPGPGDLNDLVYLRQLYAQGGRDHFDVLAAKPYGFWSGPDDRGVDPQVLNFSRIVASREIMREMGDVDKTVWAVEWGWNVLPEDWAGELPPWGSDAIAMQAPRVFGAVSRARDEWPWLEVMCWAEYQPDRATDDPRWGFALRDGLGEPTGLYRVVRDANRNQANVSFTWPLPWRWARRGWRGLYRRERAWVLLVAATGLLAVLWRRVRVGESLRGAWAWWQGWAPGYKLGALLGLLAWVMWVPWPEWVAAALFLAAFLVHERPEWALWGAIFCIPLFYLSKRIELGRHVIYAAPSELLLLVALLAYGLKAARRGRWPRRRVRVRLMDVLWVLWVLWGMLVAWTSPDPGLGWREWRLCMLWPGVLYGLLRVVAVSLHPKGLPKTVGCRETTAAAWISSGVAVAALAVGQWVTGGIVQAGHVGRAAGVYYSPTHLALYLERIWPLALAVALWGGLRGWWRRAAWGGVAVLTVGLYVTFSRAAWLLAVPVALVAIGACCRRELRWWVVVLLVAGVLVAGTGVLAGRGTSPAGLLHEVRVSLWQSTLTMIGDHPWPGVGLDGFRFVYPRYMQVEAWTEPLLYHPHNAWLDAAVRMGLPGLVLFVLLSGACVVLAMVAALRREKGAEKRQSALARAVVVGCLASLAAGLAHGLVDSGYFLPDLAWGLALVAGVVTGWQRHPVFPDKARPTLRVAAETGLEDRA